MPYGNELRSAWAEFLGQWEWQIFATQTYAEPVGYPRLAMDRLARVLRAAAIRYGLPLFAFIAAEEHKQGGYHAHGLVLARGADLRRIRGSLRFLWLLGFEMYGLCRFEDVKRVGGVSGYVSKYITKGPADYDFYRIDPA